MKHATAGLFDEESPKATSRTLRRANGLDGRTWTKWSISVWSDVRKTAEETALKHPAMFPVESPRRLIQIYTGEHQKTVLDPFAGVGTTVLAAKQLGKNGIGIELSAEYAAIAKRRLRQADLYTPDEGKGAVHLGDARSLGRFAKPCTVDLVVTSPPYWDILLQKRSADLKEVRHYGDNNGDLGSETSYKGFLRALGGVFEDVFQALRPASYCCVVVMDIRKKNKFYSFHSDLAAAMTGLGFLYDDVIIWDRRHEYNNMRPLGYPSVFRINKAHEYILIFQKPVN